MRTKHGETGQPRVSECSGCAAAFSVQSEATALKKAPVSSLPDAANSPLGSNAYVLIQHCASAHECVERLLVSLNAKVRALDYNRQLGAGPWIQQP
jgi:hypothetical protein